MGKVSLKVDDNLNYLKNLFGNGINLINNKLELPESHLLIGLDYISSISDKEMIQRHMVMPLLQCKIKSFQNPDNALQIIQAQVISATDIRMTNEMSEVISHLLNGDTALFVENATSALIIGSRKVEKRSVEAPENESTVLGSQESFTDDIETNSSLIIKRLPVQNLHIEEFTVGTLSQTKLKLIWLDGVANPEFINEARSRIQRIDIDSVNGIGAVAELIEDKPLSLFPKYRQSERPDVVSKNLTDGRFAIICSNSPFAIMAPSMFWDNFKTMDDYEERSLVSSYLRLVRYLSFLITTLLSSLYLSFVTYNQAIIPPTLALSIASGREGVPLPSILELLLLTLSISIIREAGLRMHGSVGYFMGTMAAVLIGQSVVMAGYISPALIIVVAISTISSFAITSTTMLYPARLLNYFFILLSGMFGIFGVISGIIIVFWHLCTLNTFGVAYLYPLLPFDKNGFDDVFIRPRLSVLVKRMKKLSPHNRLRSGYKSSN